MYDVTSNSARQHTYNSRVQPRAKVLVGCSLHSAMGERAGGWGEEGRPPCSVIINIKVASQTITGESIASCMVAPKGNAIKYTAAAVASVE